MKTSRRFPFLLGRILLLGIALLFLLLEILNAFPGVLAPLERIELAARDGLMRLRGTRPADADIAIVAIDDFSFNWTGYQWPWPRTYLAKLVNKLNESGARVIGLDVFLFEPGSDAGGDAALSEALAKTAKSTSVMQIFRSSTEGMVTLKQPLDEYLSALDGIGLSGVKLDDDAIVRGLQPYDNYGDEQYFNWAFETAALFLNTDPPSLNANRLVFNGKTVPLSQGRFLINFSGPGGTYPTYSAANVVDGLVDDSAFRGKIVLIGATSITLHDVYPTPFSAAEPTPGVEIVANAIGTLLQGSPLLESPLWLNLLVIAFMGGLAGLIGRIRRPVTILLVLAGTMAAYFTLAFLVFAGARFYLPVTGPEGMIFLGVLVPFIEQAISQEIEKRRVRGLFSRFLSPEMVTQMLATQDINSLNKRAELTILFSDIRGFTSLSEKMTPEALVSLLNPYLEAMTAIVHKYGGTVDKYEGDAIIAFFGEPVPHADHALRAVRTAVEMRVELNRLNKEWLAEGRLHDDLEIGIGIHTGEVFVGLLGSDQRLNYTIIGDNANLASRLQDQTKVIGWPILVSEYTANLVKEEFEVEFAALQAIKGKREPANIFKIMGPKGSAEGQGAAGQNKQTM